MDIKKHYDVPKIKIIQQNHSIISLGKNTMGLQLVCWQEVNVKVGQTYLGWMPKQPSLKSLGSTYFGFQFYNVNISLKLKS